MATKKTNGKTKNADAVKPIFVRPDGPELAVQLDAYARSIKNSRNNAILLLLEKALADVGFWPAASDKE
jgi:hypothetical protein